MSNTPPANADEFFKWLADPTNSPATVRYAKARLMAFEQILAPLHLDDATMRGVRKYLTLTPPPYPDWPNLRNIGDTWAVLGRYWEQSSKLAKALIESGVV